MFLANPTQDYHSMYGGGHTMAPNQETMHAAGAFGRMTLGPDHALEKLAANVRAATTTSASDRAKQIFVQAWYVYVILLTSIFADSSSGSPPITPHTLMETFHVRVFISLIGGCATNMAFLT
jgi:hypothetical protein